MLKTIVKIILFLVVAILIFGLFVHFLYIKPRIDEDNLRTQQCIDEANPYALCGRFDNN